MEKLEKAYRQTSPDVGFVLSGERGAISHYRIGCENSCYVEFSEEAGKEHSLVQTSFPRIESILYCLGMSRSNKINPRSINIDLI